MAHNEGGASSVHGQDGEEINLDTDPMVHALVEVKDKIKSEKNGRLVLKLNP